MNRGFRTRDAVILAILFATTALFAVAFVDFSIPPFEDAAILMRYAEHLAQGYGVVWNIGEAPVDGATDFLFMIVLGLLVRAGMSLELATRFVGLSSHIATVCIVYLASQRLFHANVLLAVLACGYLIVGPGCYYVAAYFGTPFFALLAAVTWYIALTIVMDGETPRRSVLFAASSLITGLVRPEGVILSGLMLVGLVYVNGVPRSRRTIVCYLGTLLLGGGAYFVWRWHYFGYPLPNPYYKKGASILHLTSLVASVQNTTQLCLPVLPGFILGLRSAATRRLTIGLSIPVIGLALAFVLISNEMNYGARFQYALLPVTLLSLWPLAATLAATLRLPGWGPLTAPKRALLVLLTGAVAAGVIAYGHTTAPPPYYRDGRYDVAVMLSGYRDKGYLLATTEAGLLPLYSHWKALDTWGLNDQWIAHNGGITEEYIRNLRPQVVLVHGYGSPLVPYQGTGAFFDMVVTLERYVDRNGYVLAASFGDTPLDTHTYYVRSDFADSAAIIRGIQAMEYVWFATGTQAQNYALPATE